MDTVHDAAARGFSSASKAYTRGRPDYPLALDAWLRGAVGLGSGRTVIDLGAGTGKFVPRLLATGAAVIAVEPVDAMRAELVATHLRVDARAGTATSIPLADASVDAVVCAQAFPWFATRDALAEIHRVLRPHGVLAMIWNVRDETVSWVRRMTDVLAEYEGDVPRFHRGTWRDVFPATGFGPLEEARFPHEHRGTVDDVFIDRAMSVSFIAALPEAERATVRARLAAIVASEPALRDAQTIAFPYETRAYRCVRD
jgi:SAM-dependent methyltransferase